MLTAQHFSSRRNFMKPSTLHHSGPFFSPCLHTNVVHTSSPGFSKWPLCLSLRDKNVCISYFHLACNVSHPSSSSVFDYFSITYFSPLSWNILFFRPNISQYFALRCTPSLPFGHSVRTPYAENIPFRLFVCLCLSVRMWPSVSD
jgi:hypothetical protein